MSNLGQFIREYVPNKSESPYEDDTTFYVRGLTVAEYIDLIEKTDGGIEETLFVQIALNTIQDWEHVVDENHSPIPCTDENLNGLPDDVLIDVGRYCYQRLTVLDEEKDSKIRGFVNFLYWKSDEKTPKKKAESFNCENCLSSGKAVGRKCGKYSMEFRRNYNKDNDDGQKSSNSKSKKSYGSSRTFMNRQQYEDANRMASKSGEMVLNDFRFPECPVSWIDDHLKILCETLYHAEKSDRNFFDGGIADQPYQVYKASVIIKNEYNQLEKEKMDDKTNKSTDTAKSATSGSIGKRR